MRIFSRSPYSDGPAEFSGGIVPSPFEPPLGTSAGPVGERGIGHEDQNQNHTSDNPFRAVLCSAVDAEMSNVVWLFRSREYLIGRSIFKAIERNLSVGGRLFDHVYILERILDGDEKAQAYFREEVIAEYRILTGAYIEADEVEDCAFTDPDFVEAVNGAFHT
jgi:hypothetical protein